MKPFKLIKCCIRLLQLRRPLEDMCDHATCRNCKCYLGDKIPDSHVPLCAQWYVYDEALKRWGIEEDTND